MERGKTIKRREEGEMRKRTGKRIREGWKGRKREHEWGGVLDVRESVIL